MSCTVIVTCLSALWSSKAPQYSADQMSQPLSVTFIYSQNIACWQQTDTVTVLSTNLLKLWDEKHFS